METASFMKLVEDNYKKRVEILTQPKKSRTKDGMDRLHQFKRMAVVKCSSAPSAAVELCIKQFTDIVDMAAGRHPSSGNVEYMKELIFDVQNYLDLTLACVLDEVEGRNVSR